MSGLYLDACIVLFVAALVVVERIRLNNRHAPDLPELQKRRAELVEYLNELDHRPHSLREMLDAEEMLYLIEYQIERAPHRNAPSTA